MHVADDLPVAANGLRRSVIFCGWVDKVTGCESRDRDGNIKVRVGIDIDTGLGICDHSRDHLVFCGDVAHGNAIAGAGHILLAVGDGLA